MLPFECVEKKGEGIITVWDVDGDMMFYINMEGEFKSMWREALHKNYTFMNFVRR